MIVHETAFSLTASVAAAKTRSTFTEDKIPSADEKPSAVDQSIRHFFPRFAVDALDSGPGDVHLDSALFLQQTLKIDQSDGFVFIHGHYYGVFQGLRRIGRAELIAFGKTTYSSHLTGTRHFKHLLYADSN